MRRFVLLAAGLGVLCSEASSKSRDVVRLQPVEPWNLHYADDSCRLLRPFGTGDDQVILVLDQFVPGDWFRMSLIGEKLPDKNSGAKGTVRFGPDEAASEVRVTLGTSGEKRALFVNESVRIAPLTKAEEKKDAPEPAPIGEAREAAAKWLELKKLYRDVVLETGSMAKPLAGLRACSWETVGSWGLDVEQQKKLTRKPETKRSASTWFDASEYPPSMIAGGHQGVVNFRMIVDAKGKATACHIQKSTRPQEFDDLVCKSAMKRARFEPALDAEGKPVPSYWHGTVRFVIQG